MLQRADHLFFVLDRRQRIAKFSAVTLDARAHYIFKQRTGAVAVDRIGVENADPRVFYRARLENRAALVENRKNRFELRLRHRERGALNGCNALAGAHKAVVLNRGNRYAAGAIDLAQKL